MSALVRFVEIKEGIKHLCSEIDAGRLPVDERKMLVIAELLNRDYGKHPVFGPVAKDLIYQIASRTKNGHAVLNRMAQ